jgi:hypothetical protein
MTKREREIILKAVDCIMDDEGDFEKGIHILLKLCGGRYPAYEIRKNLKSITLSEIACRGNQKFSVSLK